MFIMEECKTSLSLRLGCELCEGRAAGVPPEEAEEDVLCVGCPGHRGFLLHHDEFCCLNTHNDEWI